MWLVSHDLSTPIVAQYYRAASCICQHWSIGPKKLPLFVIVHVTAIWRVVMVGSWNKEFQTCNIFSLLKRVLGYQLLPLVADPPVNCQPNNHFRCLDSGAHITGTYNMHVSIVLKALICTSQSFSLSVPSVPSCSIPSSTYWVHLFNILCITQWCFLLTFC